jgi:type I restriction enzyme S subunit
MPAEWPRCALERLAAPQAGAIAIGPFGSRLKTDAYTTHGVALIRGTNLAGSKFLSGEFVYVSETTARTLGHANVKPWDLVFPHRGNIGAVGLVPADGNRYALSTSLMKVTLDSHRVDPLFVYYFFRSPVGQSELLKNASQVGTPGIATPLTSLRACVVPVPPLEDQTAVAEVLSSLDDRIELLRQTNATLEAIAQALFKSWFIDFDPVRAKAEGREPEGMDAATAALFPAEFEDSPLGLIPKGWAVGTLAEHVDAERGLSYKGAGLCSEGEGLPMHNLNSVLEGGGYKYAGIKFYRGDYKDRHLTDAGDVIVANTEQGHDHLLIGYPAIVPGRYGRALFSHHLYRVRPKASSPLTRHTLYYMLMAPRVRDQVIGCANGSTVNMLKVAGLQIPELVCPSTNVARVFETTVAPLRAQMEANVLRMENLAAVRDTLLPRLISGKLRLPEARTQVEEALA